MLFFSLHRKKEQDQCKGFERCEGGQPFGLFLICLLIAVFAGILYFNSLGNQFTNWDDGMIYNNSTIRNLNWEGIKRIFTYEKANTYQPIRMLSYAIDYKFWKLNPLGYRITNILFYILTCIMVFFTLRHLSVHLRDQVTFNSHAQVALFGTLLFTAHPVHVEAVTWLAARKEVLQGFFFFLAFYLYLKGREEEGRKKLIYFVLVLLSFLFAILSKPSAIVFPAVLLIYEIAVAQNRWIGFVKKHWLFFSISTLISFIFVSVLIKVMLDAGGIKPYRGGSFLNNLLISSYAFLYNIKLLVSTINFSAAYTISIPNPIWGFQTFLFVGITFLLFGLSLWSLRRTKVIFFTLFFFFVTLLPYLNIIPISTLLADRYVFIASLSYCFLLGIGFDKFYRVRAKRFSEGFFKLLSIAIFFFILMGYSFMTIHQNQIWENSYTLWADAVEKYPDSNTANALMGVVYMDLGMDEKAAKYLEKAIESVPYDYQSRNNLGVVYGRSGQPEKALKEFMTAIWLNPENDTTKINLSVFYQRQKEYKKCEEVLEHLISKDPRNANLYFRLGLLYKEMGRYDAAIAELIKSMELAPHIINPYEELGNIYLSRMKDTEKAKYFYLKGIEAAPKVKSRVEDLRWMIQDLECHQ
jgi:Tfp pilus assembly protein PilF